jgi:hypothetical protein
VKSNKEKLGTQIELLHLRFNNFKKTLSNLIKPIVDADHRGREEK